jgi:hypothetical protein
MGLLTLIKSLSKRNKVENWEIDLLINSFDLLPNEYVSYRQQLEEGLVAGVILSDTPLPNCVNFTFNPKVSRKYENESDRFFRITGLEFYDERLGWKNFEVYCTHGLICGYRMSNGLLSAPNVLKINAQHFQKEYLDNYSIGIMKSILSPSEINLINSSDFYEVELQGKEYYHVKDLEDGDFIGIDREKNVYKFTHDPFEITYLEGDIESNLAKF